IPERKHHLPGPRGLVPVGRRPHLGGPDGGGSAGGAGVRTFCPGCRRLERAGETLPAPRFERGGSVGRGTASATGPGEAAPGGMGFRQRLLGVDVARALAIIGMLMVHFGPVNAPGLAGALYALPYGRASVLFVLVAGVGVSLFARSGRSREDVARRLIWRALVLFPLGLWLQSLDDRVLVILQEYAVLFLLAAAVLDFPDAALLSLAGVSAAAGPVVFLLGRMHAPDLFDQGPIRWSDPPSEMLMDLVVSGPYPLAVWAAPFLFGMWIGRRDLRSAAVRV